MTTQLNEYLLTTANKLERTATVDIDSTKLEKTYLDRFPEETATQIKKVYLKTTQVLIALSYMKSPPKLAKEVNAVLYVLTHIDPKKVKMKELTKLQGTVDGWRKTILPKAGQLLKETGSLAGLEEATAKGKAKKASVIFVLAKQRMKIKPGGKKKKKKWVACTRPKRERTRGGPAWTSTCLWVAKDKSDMGTMKRIVGKGKRRPKEVQMGGEKVKIVNDLKAVSDKIKAKIGGGKDKDAPKPKEKGKGGGKRPSKGVIRKKVDEATKWVANNQVKFNVGKTVGAIAVGVGVALATGDINKGENATRAVSLGGSAVSLGSGAAHGKFFNAVAGNIVGELIGVAGVEMLASGISAMR